MARKRRTDNKGYVLQVGESQDKSGRYCFKYTDKHKKRRAVYALTLKELREKEKQIRKDIEDGIDTSKQDMTLNQLFQAYIEVKTDLRESTRANYIAVWNNAIKDTIGEKKISKISQIDIQKFYAGLVKQGIASNTIKFYHSLIHPTLEMAVDNDIIRKNPAKNARKGVKGEKKEKEALTIEQQEKLLDFLKENNIYSMYYPMIIFALSTGLRVGELTGLRWSDVDLKDNVIHVSQQLIYKNLGDGCKFYVQDLKTDAGRRDIPLTTNARKSLIKQKEIYLLFGLKQQHSIDGINDFVFLNSLGKPYPVNAINAMLKNVVGAFNKIENDKAKKEHREPEIFPHMSAHILRHTACTRLAESGIDPKTLQYIMGHSSISITMDVYNHVDAVRVKGEMKKAEDAVKYG